MNILFIQKKIISYLIIRQIPYKLLTNNHISFIMFDEGTAKEETAKILPHSFIITPMIIKHALNMTKSASVKLMREYICALL